MILRDRPALTAPADPGPSSRPEPLALTNLLSDLETLARLLGGELQRGAWLDAFLLAAGINQIVEDFLHRDPYSLTKVAKHLARLPGTAGRVAGGGASAVGELLWRLRSRRPDTAALIRWQEDLGRFVQRLGQMAACSALHTRVPAAELAEQYEVLLDTIGAVPEELRREVLRLPACFRSFDQRPADMERLVDSFVSSRPDRARPLLVAGVRTSGSYLAPLLAAQLSLHGYQSVAVMTMRPGQRLLSSERELLRRTAGAAGLVLITDDPPTSGETLARAAEQLELSGFDRASIILCLQLFGGFEALPASLEAYKSILLPEEDWSIQDDLQPSAIWTAVNELLDGEAEVMSIDRLALPERSWRRGHLRGLYRVGLRLASTGELTERMIYAKGAGLGYFGQHSVAVARPLTAFLPRVYGLRAGLLYREWLPEQSRVDRLAEPETDAVQRAIASYAIARSQSLAVSDDTSLRLVNRDPVWQRASDLLARGFGRAAPLARPALHMAAKELLDVPQPAVLDGAMAPSRWFLAQDGRGGLLKTNFAERAFSNRDMHCFDPIMDLAAATSAGRESGFATGLRGAYERLASRPIEPERWLLYQILQLQEEERQHEQEIGDVQRALARLMQQYYGDSYMDRTVPQSGNPLCAIDIDGVLETGWLGFSSTTPAGALTLRALTMHGYSPVLASGRSLDEVRERCGAFALAGGVAEYGAAIYIAATGEVRTLLSAEEALDLDTLRRSLTAVPGVHLDEDYRLAIRAYRLQSGVRRRLPPELIDAALATTGLTDRLRPIAGERQTDFVPVGVNKGTGLAVLARDLHAPGDSSYVRPVALAVGDTVSDLPLFQLAAIGVAPANADRQIREARMRIMSRPYQAGLSQAAALLLGHSPGGCDLCRFVPSGPGQALLLQALQAQDAGRWGKLSAAFRLARLVRPS